MLEIKNIYKAFNKNTENEVRLFEDFSLNFETGTCTALIGTNGSGKSTLLNIIGGSITQDAGEILINGKEISGLREEQRAVHIGKVHQDTNFGVCPSLTILENMSLADKKGERFSLKKLIDLRKLDVYRKLLKELDLGLENKMGTKVKFLSGGQKQSLSLIMATMKHPDLLLLDEHTAALDPKTSTVIMEKTKKLIKTKKLTTIMISHNMKDALKYSDRVIMLDTGKIVLDELSANLTEKQLSDIYLQKVEGLIG